MYHAFLKHVSIFIINCVRCYLFRLYPNCQVPQILSGLHQLYFLHKLCWFECKIYRTHKLGWFECLPRCMELRVFKNLSQTHHSSRNTCECMCFSKDVHWGSSSSVPGLFWHPGFLKNPNLLFYPLIPVQKYVLISTTLVLQAEAATKRQQYNGPSMMKMEVDFKVKLGKCFFQIIVVSVLVI